MFDCKCIDTLLSDEDGVHLVNEDEVSCVRGLASSGRPVSPGRGRRGYAQFVR
jgi:hypothetical protein